jgi:hypothetical protein
MKYGMKKDKKRKGYMGGGMKEGYAYGGNARKPMKHGGQHGYSSIKDLEDSCNRMVGYNTMDIKGDR